MDATDISNNIVSAANGKGGGVFFGAGVIYLFGVVFQDNDANSGDGMYRVNGTAIGFFPTVTYINDTEVIGPY
jgi:hypothetical protein